MSAQRRIEVAPAFADLYRPARFKIFYGGRGSAKSWEIAEFLVAQAHSRPVRILCAREYQNSIKDSSKRLLEDTIERLNLAQYFTSTETAITSQCGSEFMFKGLARNVQGIKSTEGVDYFWGEEAQTISAASLRIVIPTIRKAGSELLFSYNPDRDEDPMHQLTLSLRDDPDAIVRKVSYRDNPWFPAELEAERLRLLRTDPDHYEHVWEGECLRISEAVIFRHRVTVEDFETPADARFYFGADWGFARDPSALVRCFIKDDCLFIDWEAGGVGIELDDLPSLFDSIPGSRKWPIKGDNARPETISYMTNRHGFNITAAEKWKGSVEDGVSRLKAFTRIVVHPRCQAISKEFRMYSYKVDKTTGDILPVIVDAWNHYIDALRYALDGVIQNQRGPIKFSSGDLNRLRGWRAR